MQLTKSEYCILKTFNFLTGFDCGPSLQVGGLQQTPPRDSWDPRQQRPGGGPATPVPPPRQLPLGEALFRGGEGEKAGLPRQRGRERGRREQRRPGDTHWEPLLAVLSPLPLVGILVCSQVLPAREAADRKATGRWLFRPRSSTSCSHSDRSGPITRPEPSPWRPSMQPVRGVWQPQALQDLPEGFAWATNPAEELQSAGAERPVASAASAGSSAGVSGRPAGGHGDTGRRLKSAALLLL